MNSNHFLVGLPWDILLRLSMQALLDPDSQQDIRKEIIRRCPEFEAKLDENLWNLIHLASEYGYVELVQNLTLGPRPCFYFDKDDKTPLDCAAMKGKMEVVQILLETLPLSATTKDVNNTIVEKALYLALQENQRQAFRALAIKYMENWDAEKVAIIKANNKLLKETLKPSDDVRTADFEALNKILMSAIRSDMDECMNLENLLANDPVLFKTLSSRSCPLQTQFYLCVLTMQTDDLLDEINKMRLEFESAEDLYLVDRYPMHRFSKYGYNHIVNLIFFYESGSSSACLLKDMNGNTPLHCAVQFGNVSVIDTLLENCWGCAGLVSDKKNETALHCAIRNNKAKAFKTLLKWYIIKEEFLNNYTRDWECEDTALHLLVGGYENIVKELLCQSESKVCFQREYWEGKEYFVVIKCKNKESVGASFKYRDYIREVTSKTTNQTVLSLTVDSRFIITLKVLIRSVIVKGMLDARDVEGYTVFDLLDKVKTINVMGFVTYERYENVIWLLDAIQMGDYQAFYKLQVEDPHILDYICKLPLGGTPLHIAVRFGQLNDCTREIIRKRPVFAGRKDHKARIPLHIASAKGYLDIVKELLTQFGFSQCFASTEEDTGEFYETPLHFAIQKGRISVMNELFPVWWRSAGVIGRKNNPELLESAVIYNQLEALKFLMERYIEAELLKTKEEDGYPMSALADGYIEIVLKHLLSQKADYSLSILVKNRDDWKTTDTKLHQQVYFAVIKTSSSRRKDNNIVDELQLSAYYPKYFREVTVGNKMVLHLSVDDENSVIFKLLLQSPLYDEEVDVTIFELLRAELEIKHEVVEDKLGILLPIWKNKISNACPSSSINVYDDAKEQIGEGPKYGYEGAVADNKRLSVAAKEKYEYVLENVKADNNDVEDDQVIPTEIPIPIRLDGYTTRYQDRIAFSNGQSFESLYECRNAIKDAAIQSKTEVQFSKSTGDRIVAACSHTFCKWKIRAKAMSGKRSNYVVTEIWNEHTCPRLEGNTNKHATPTWVSSHIIDNVRHDHNISTQQIKAIMKQSKYHIDINCKTAERAKKRALDTIQESSTVPKKQRQYSIASSSLPLNAQQSLSNLRFLEQIPKPMHEYIACTEDVEKDGHCGYRVIAMQTGYEAADAWKQVRRELLFEVVQNEELYVKVMDIDTVAEMRKSFAYVEDLADHQYWLQLHNAGYVIANAYKAVVVSLSVKYGYSTFLPLFEPPPEGQPHHIITFGFVDGNHFISVNLKHDAPIPQVDCRWDSNVAKAAKVWKTYYLSRFDKFKKIMGFNLDQEDNTIDGRCPIILET